MDMPETTIRPTTPRVLALRGALAATVLTVACQSTPATTSKTAAPAVVVTADTWAVVDGQVITRADVDKAYTRTRDTAPALSEEETLIAKLSLLNDLIVQEILTSKALAQKVDVPQTDVDAAYAEAKKNIPEDAFQQELTKRGMTAGEMQQSIRRELVTQKVITQEVGSKVVVSDQDVTAFFDANRAQFNIPEESFHLAQIAITPVRDAQLTNQTGDDATTPKAAAAKAQMLMERLKSGASFQEMAVGYSEDPESAPRGGDLGLVPLSRLMQAPPALRNAVLKKDIGTVTVASVDGGYTLVLVAGHEQPGQRDLSTPGVRDQITGTLRTRKEQLLRAAYLTSIRNDAQVVNYLARRIVEAKGQMPSMQMMAPGAK